MTNVRSGARDDDLSSLAPGKKVQALDSHGNRWMGKGVLSSPDQGILWIHTSAGERKLPGIQEHRIRLVP
ncbi:hypothetical protein QFZ23_004698 [Arthrobacter globiformis]|nr:hypothetical protein [Arthrobacter globiformis]